MYNPGLFPKLKDKNVPNRTEVDFTHSDPRPEMDGYIIGGNVYDHPDLRFTLILTSIGFLIPFAVLVLGRAIWWVAMGFRG